MRAIAFITCDQAAKSFRCNESRTKITIRVTSVMKLPRIADGWYAMEEFAADDLQDAEPTYTTTSEI